jgi:hypothetical protein
VLSGPRRAGHGEEPLLSRAKVKEGLAVAAAEQEDEPLQVITQLGQAVGGVADELCQGFAQAGGVAGQPLAEELQQLSELGRVDDVFSELCKPSCKVAMSHQVTVAA